MKTKDSKGRYSKQNVEGGLVLTVPNISTILYWIILAFIFLPWFIIITKFNLIERISTIFDSLFKDSEPEKGEQNKKNGLFY